MLDDEVDDDFIKYLLNFYKGIYNLDIQLKIIPAGKIVSSGEDTSIYCQRIRKECPCICDKVFSSPGKIQCDAGLWCYNIPISYDDQALAIISVGHSRLDYKDNDSLVKMNQLHSNLGISKEKLNEYVELFYKLSPINIDNFNKINADSFQILIKYIISEYLETTREEVRINKLKSMAASLAHQFLLPIQAITADAENVLLEMSAISSNCVNTEIYYQITEIIKEVTILSYSAENLRDWMAEERELFDYDFRNIPIQDLLHDTVDLFRRDAMKRNILLNYPIPKRIPFPVLKLSDHHMRKVLFNLVHNAVKYSFAGTHTSKRRIDIECYPYGKFYCIEITNVGVGIMQDEILERIYQKRFRGKFARDRHRDGTGLGLWSAKKIIEGHGGKIEAESRLATNSWDGAKVNPYRTTFRVYLPSSAV